MSLTVETIKHKLILRVLIDGRCNNSSYAQLCISTFYALNEILHEQGLDNEVWAIKRGRRLYLIHAECKRIICEIGISAEPAADFFIITLRGVVPPTTTLQSLAQMTAKRGTYRNSTKFNRRRNNE